MSNARRLPPHATNRRIILGVTVDQSVAFYERLASVLISEDWEVHLVSSPGDRLRQLEAMGVHTHTIRMRRHPALFDDIRAFCSWVRVLRHIRPDIALIGTPKAALLGLMAAALNRIPGRIYHMRGLRLETTIGILRTVLHAMERLTMASSTRVLSVSTSLTRAIVERGLASAEKIDMIASGSSRGVDTAHFRKDCIAADEIENLRTQLGLDTAQPVVGYVGRVSKDKGIDDLAQALVALKHEGHDIQLLVVGEYDDASYRPFTNSALQPVMVPHVRDVRPYYAIMDVLCLPTLREGFPNVALEAAAMETPVVTTTATGAIDSIVNGHTGLSVPPAQPQELATALRRLLFDVDLQRRYGHCGRDWVVAHFDADLVLKRTVEYLSAYTPTSN